MKQKNKKEKYKNSDTLVQVIDELPLWSAPFGLKLLDRIDYKKNISVLDIGSGTGFPMLEIAMRLGETSRVYGIDPWKAAVNRIKMKIKEYGITNAKIITGIAEKIPLKDNSIDLVVSNNGLNNVQDLEKTLGEIYRVLKSNVKIIFTMNLEDTMKEFYTVFETVLKRNKLFNSVKRMQEHIYEKRKPEKEIKTKLINAGFKNINKERDSFKLTYADGTAMLNHFLIKLAFKDSWNQIVERELRKIIFKETEDELNRISRRNGGLVLTVPFALFECSVEK